MDVGDFGDAEESAQVGHLDRDPMLLEGVVDERDVLVLAEEHRHFAPGHTIFMVRPHFGRDRLGLVDCVGRPTDGHCARRRPRHRLEWRPMAGVDLTPDSIGQVEDGAPRAAVEREWQCCRLGTIPQGEVPGEAGEILQ